MNSSNNRQSKKYYNIFRPICNERNQINKNKRLVFEACSDLEILIKPNTSHEKNLHKLDKRLARFKNLSNTFVLNIIIYLTILSIEGIDR